MPDVGHLRNSNSCLLHRHAVAAIALILAGGRRESAAHFDGHDIQRFESMVTGARVSWSWSSSSFSAGSDVVIRAGLPQCRRRARVALLMMRVSGASGRISCAGSDRGGNSSVGLVAGAMLTKAVRAGESGTRPSSDDIADAIGLSPAGLGTGQLRRHLYDPAAGLDPAAERPAY
jgi:hypothetical protein